MVTRIADLTLRTLTDYHTNYSGYLVEHHERIEALRKAKREQDEEVARIKMFIDRFRYQATKASQVQSRIKHAREGRPNRRCLREGPHSLHVSAVCQKRTDGSRASHMCGRRTTISVVFDDLSLHIERGDRIGARRTERNGKSTLME